MEGFVVEGIITTFKTHHNEHLYRTHFQTPLVRRLLRHLRSQRHVGEVRLSMELSLRFDTLRVRGDSWANRTWICRWILPEG